MHKLLVFTDIHIVREGKKIIGLDPLDRFSAALDHALAHHRDAERVIITGDLAHWGQPKEYARLREVLDRCPLPLSITIGNHDLRHYFREAFPEIPTDPNGYVQSVAEVGGYRLILLDTVDAEAEIPHSGRLCTDRLEWLDQTLDAAPDKPTILFMHHPPMITGFPGMDRIGLTNMAELNARLARHGQIRQIIAGHVHRTMAGSAAGIPVMIYKSPCHQMPLSFSSDDEHLSIDEPGAYGVLLLKDDGVIVHTEDILPNGPTGDPS